jgi:site-specific DNA-cytosine methylase
MTRPVCLSLFDYSGEWARPWLATHRVILADVRHPLGWRDYDKDGLATLGADARFWRNNFALLGAFRDVDCVLSAPPCTHFSKAGARLWNAKDADGRTAEHLDMVRCTLDLIDALQPRVWALENPPGRLANKGGTGLMQTELGVPRYEFDPCDHGDAHRKRTYLWGQFAIPARHPVEPATFTNGVPGGRNWLARLSSKDERRRTTPAGFARDFYAANKPPVKRGRGRPPKGATARSVRREIRMEPADAAALDALRQPGESRNDADLRVLRAGLASTD